MTPLRFRLPPVPQLGASLALLLGAYSTPVLATFGGPLPREQAASSLAAPASAGAAGAAERAESAPRYTCPMHPEVDSDKPGRCPHCGMKLEEKKTPEPHAAR